MAEGKSDLEKTGEFKESGFISIGDPYKGPNATTLPPQCKGKQMLTAATKSRAAAGEGFFEPKFPRAFEGEAFFDPVKAARKQKQESTAKNVGGAFVPASAPKSTGGPGNNFGTFSGKIEHFEAITEPPKAKGPEKRNFYTNPPKKGTGYGYLGVTIGALPKYESEPYDAAHDLERKEHEKHKAAVRSGTFKVHTAGPEVFDVNPYKTDRAAPPAEEEGGKKAEKKKSMPFYRSRPGLTLQHGGKYFGTFEHYPAHADEPPAERPPPVHEKVFRPPFRSKSRPVQSVLARNVTRSINARTYRSVHVS